ncbi:hypothetical protein AAC387_Pa09g2265 [Persea americana]
MSATISFKTPGFWRISSHPNWKHSPFCSTPISLSIKQIGSMKPQLPSIPHPTDAPRSRNIRFSKMLSSDSEGSCKHEKDFDCFTVREAMLDEEYWTAAWLRAESHWEDQLVDRFIDSRKRKFAEQEFYALKRRCNGHPEKCTCFVAVKSEETNSKRTVMNSVIGTLDISIRYLLHGETFPGEQSKSSFTGFSKTKRHSYGYISNLCVAKLARHRGIASKMLHLAIQVAKSSGLKKVFVHVHKDNKPALQLYEKMGFQMVETSITHSSEPNYLLCIEIS